jgi:hypothetical protein
LGRLQIDLLKTSQATPIILGGGGAEKLVPNCITFPAGGVCTCSDSSDRDSLSHSSVPPPQNLKEESVGTYSNKPFKDVPTDSSYKSCGGGTPD